MKKPRQGRILGIDPGTKHLGTAILEGRELIHHAVMDVSARNTRATLASTRRVVGRLMDAYQPDLLAIERTFFAKGRNAGLLRLVTDEIVAVAQEHAVHVDSVAPSTVKKAVTGNGHASKREVARAVCVGFPQLRAFMDCNRLWKDRYHSNMFDAIAVAAVAVGRSEEGAGKLISK